MCQYAKEKSTKKYEIIDVIKTTENGYLIQQFINAIKSIALSLQYNHNVYPVINNAITKYYDKGILNSNDVISKIHIVKEQISYHYEFFPGDIYTLSEYKQRNIEYSKYIDSLSFSHKPIEEIYYIAIPTTVYFSGKVECTILPLNVSLLVYIKTKDYLYQKFSEKYNKYINKKIVLPMTYNGNKFNIFLNTVSLENTLISTISEWLKKVNKYELPKKYGDVTIATFLSVLKNITNLISQSTNEEKLSIINYFDNDSIFKCISFEFGSESVVCNSLASELMYALLLDKNTLIMLRDNNSPFEIKDGKLYFKEVYLATIPHVQDKRCKYTYINLNVQCYLPMNTISVKLYIDNNHIPYVKHMQNFIPLEKYLLSFYDIKEYDEALTNALKCAFDYNKNIDIVDSVLSNMPQTGNKVPLGAQKQYKNMLQMYNTDYNSDNEFDVSWTEDVTSICEPMNRFMTYESDSKSHLFLIKDRINKTYLRRFTCPTPVTYKNIDGTQSIRIITRFSNGIYYKPDNDRMKNAINIGTFENDQYYLIPDTWISYLGKDSQICINGRTNEVVKMCEFNHCYIPMGTYFEMLHNQVNSKEKINTNHTASVEQKIKQYNDIGSLDIHIKSNVVNNCAIKSVTRANDGGLVCEVESPQVSLLFGITPKNNFKIKETLNVKFVIGDCPVESTIVKSIYYFDKNAFVHQDSKIPYNSIKCGTIDGNIFNSIVEPNNYITMPYKNNIAGNDAMLIEVTRLCKLSDNNDPLPVFIALHEDNNLIPKLYDLYISTNNVCYILINTLNSDNTYTSHLQLLSEYLSKFKPNRNNNT